jgi:hypothetical protein
MSNASIQISADEQLGQERNAEFERRLAELRGSDSRPHGEAYLKRAIQIADETFQTPTEFAKYAIPYLTTTRDYYHGSDSRHIPPLLEKWKLTNKSQTVITVMDYVAKNSNWFGSEFVNQYGALAKRYLPENKRGVVFNRLLQQRGYPIPRTNDITERAEFWAKTVQDYVPQDKWPTAYNVIKQLLIHAVKRPSKFGNVDINKEKIERAAEILARFGAALPLNAKRKSDVLNDVISLLTTPEQFYPDKEIKEAEHRFAASRKGIILFEAKRDLDASRINPSDYEEVVAFINDDQNSSDLSDKIDTLKSCAEKCIPEEDRVDRVVTDILYLGALSLSKTPYAYNLSTVSEKIQSGFEGLSLNDEHRWKFKSLIETFAIKMAVKGELGDEGLYATFNKASESLTPEQVLAWSEEMTEKPFLDSELANNQGVMPFIAFLQNQFKKAVGSPEDAKVVATSKIAGGYVAREFVMVFSDAVLKPAQSQESKNRVSWLERLARLYAGTSSNPRSHIALYAGEFLAATEALKTITDKSSFPAVRDSNLAGYNAITAALNQKREIA